MLAYCIVSTGGLWRCCTPFPRKTDYRTFFCSELCVCALQAAGMLRDEVAAACTPTHLYALVTALGGFTAGAPARLLDQRLARKKLTYGRWKRPLVV